MTKTALIPVAAKFVDDEVIYPYYRLQEAGFKVDVYCAKPSEWKYGDCCYGKYGVPVPVNVIGAGGLFYYYGEGGKPAPDLIVVPGGTESTEVLRQDVFLLQLIQRMMKEEKVVAAFCHGPQVLINAGVTKGRKMTCYQGMRIDLGNSGAILPKLDDNVRVVVDENLVTAQHYKDNPAFMKAVLETYRLRNEVIH